MANTIHSATTMGPTGEAIKPTEDSPANDLRGQILGGRYRISRLLGAGGMGTVYLAEHIYLGRLTALKLLRQSLLSNPHMEERFRREALLAARINVGVLSAPQALKILASIASEVYEGLNDPHNLAKAAVVQAEVAAQSQSPNAAKRISEAALEHAERAQATRLARQIKEQIENLAQQE